MKHSFSHGVKVELAKENGGCKACKASQLYGMLLFARGQWQQETVLSTEHRQVSQMVADLLTATQKVAAYVVSTQEQTKPHYAVVMKHPADLQMIKTRFLASIDEIDYNYIEQMCCLQAFLRGCFMVCGSVTNPEIEYHLEFVCYSQALADALTDALEQAGLVYKQTRRKQQFVLYTKESEVVEDTLTLMGATKASLEMMNIKIYKDLRNHVNRAANCDAANIEKTVNASLGQLEAIELIRDTIGFDALDEGLRTTAKLRMDNPQASLRELCDLSGGALSRSGIYHRLKKLGEIAKEL